MKAQAIAFAISLGATPSAPALAQAVLKADPERAQAIVSRLCVACHAADGNSMLPENPRLAGLQAEYLAKQLNDFKKGDRSNEVMTPMVAGLGADDISSLAVFFSEKRAAPGSVRRPQLIEAGKKVYNEGNVESGVPSCSGCHYPDGSGTKRFPRLAGQHAEYTLKQMKDFKNSKRENDRGLVMQSVALRLSDAEMEAVAEYIAGLK